VLSLSTLSTPTSLNDLKECNEYPWKIEDDNKKGFIIRATSHIWGNNSYSGIFVGRIYNCTTGIIIPTHSRVCLEVNTHMGILDYFITDKHIKHRVVNIPKDVYFAV
jgi:hypothetical protein